MSDIGSLADIDNHWEMIERKRELAEAFLQNPSRDAFAGLIDRTHFWATRARGSTEHYLDNLIFAEDQTPESVAEAIERVSTSRRQCCLTATANSRERTSIARLRARF